MSRIGLDIGGSKMIGVLTEADGTVVSVLRRETPAGGGNDIVLQAALDLVRQLLVKSDGESVESLGIGIAGYVERPGGLIHYSPNLGLERFPLGKSLHAELGMPVFVDNDVNCGLLGEMTFGAARGVRDAIAIYVGTGIGTAMCVDGRLVRGSRGLGAEAGHMLFTPGGRRCVCGRRGCFEAYAGGRVITALVEDARRNAPDSALGKETGSHLGVVHRCMMAGDLAARKIWADVQLALRVLVTNLLTVFDPAMVVLGGKVVEATPELLHDIQDFALDSGMKGLMYSPLITLVALGDRSVALGATRLADEAQGASA